MRSHGPNDLTELHRALPVWDADYDPAERMIRKPFHSPGYHTAYTGQWTHPTRTSLEYALALLDSGEEDRLQRAIDTLDRVLALQDADRDSRTYGIWSWFMEEPLERMSPPDWNWADFCGTCLAQVAMDHRDRLPEGLAARVDESLHHATRSIMRRDVGPGYTNIALMGTHVTYMVGELYADREVLKYAQMRLRRFEAHTREQGAFNEYNSPTYTALAIRILARMRRDIQEPAAHSAIHWLYDLVWSDVARHFHPPTRQWAGPHSRCYATLLRPETLGFLQRALGPGVRLLDGDPPPDIEANRLNWPCPAESASLLEGLDGPREFAQVYAQGTPPVVGHTYMDETVAVGSVSRGTFWNQQRAVVAYWGEPGTPIALQVQVLHDGYDYCSALLFAQQAGPYVLAAVAFATDGGDTHPNLDRVQDGTIEAEDLRLRLRIINAAPEISRPELQALARSEPVRVGNAVLALRVAEAVFGDHEPLVETGRDGDDVVVDLVLFSGQARRIDFRSIGAAAVLCGVSVTCDPPQAGPVEVSRRSGAVEASWETAAGALHLGILERPAPAAEIVRAANGTTVV